jgi:hypothetical protein
MTEPPDLVDPQQRVHRALAPLARLDQRPLAEHVTLFEDLHAALNDALATDASAAPSGPQ